MLDSFATDTKLQDIAPSIQPVDLEEPVSTENLHYAREVLPEISKVLLSMMQLRNIVSTGKGAHLSKRALIYINGLMKLLKLVPS